MLIRGIWERGRGIAAGNNIQWAKTFIDAMKTRKDPRLPVIASLKNGDRTVAKQRGIPSGTDATGLKTLDETNLDNYSRVAPNMYALDNPVLHHDSCRSTLTESRSH